MIMNYCPHFRGSKTRAQKGHISHDDAPGKFQSHDLAPGHATGARDLWPLISQTPRKGRHYPYFIETRGSDKLSVDPRSHH